MRKYVIVSSIVCGVLAGCANTRMHNPDNMSGSGAPSSFPGTSNLGTSNPPSMNTDSTRSGTMSPGTMGPGSTGPINPGP